MRVEIYTDGSCLGNPGDGGAGWVIKQGDTITKHSLSIGHTTNNRAELIAIIEALKMIDNKEEVEIHSDSQYSLNLIPGRPMSHELSIRVSKAKVNNDLIVELRELVGLFSQVFKYWVKAHNGHEYNEIADSLALSAAKNQTDIKKGIAMKSILSREQLEDAIINKVKDMSKSELIKTAGSIGLEP